MREGAPMSSDTKELANQIAQIPVELHGIKWSSKARVTTLKHDHEKIVALLDAFERPLLQENERLRNALTAISEMANDEIHRYADEPRRIMWQIEADARAALSRPAEKGEK